MRGASAALIVSGSLHMTNSSLLEGLDRDMRAWRRHLHANPEFGFEERQTAAFVAEKLRSFGITDVVEGVGGTGVVATLKCGTGNKAIAFRADMDALRITEVTGLSYQSTKPGLMHACGHDGHTTMLLGAAKMLSQTRNFDGTIRFLFQPAEEWGRGMLAMLDDGLLQRFPFDEIYGLHNRPGLAIGHFETRTGAYMAAEDNFEIILKGSGGHASRPHQCRDALVAACAVVMELQTIVARTIDPAELAVVSVTELLTDGTRNAIAGNARILGDCRNFNPAVSTAIEAAMRRIATGVAAAHNCEVSISYTHEFVPLINDVAATEQAVAVARAAFGADAVQPVADRMGAAEDFAQALRHVPGNFANIGNGNSAVCHAPDYDFNDDASVHGVRYFVGLAESRLAKAGQ
jgi:amidohydrolase